MASNIRRAKLVTLLGCSLCSCWSGVKATTVLADDPSQFHVSDYRGPATASTIETPDQALIGPSGPIHSVLELPHSIPVQAKAKQLGSTVAYANRTASMINLMDLQVAEKGESKPVPMAPARVPGRMVLQDLKAPTQTAPTAKSNSTSEPISVLPITPAAKDAKTDGQGQLSTEAMIGPLADSIFLFSKLNISENYASKLSIPQDFRSMPAQPGAAIRSHLVEPGLETAWFNQSFTWIAPAFYHNPLYYEQPNLERYGIGPCRVSQPALSAAHFFGSFALAPYKILTQHPCEKVYTLGHCRPGNLVPVQRLTLIGQSYPGEIHKYWEKYSGYR